MIQPISICAPQRMSIHVHKNKSSDDVEACANTLCFLAHIYNTTYPHQRVILDFSRTSKLSATAALIIFAHINELLSDPHQARQFDIITTGSPKEETLKLLVRAIKASISHNSHYAVSRNVDMFCWGDKVVDCLSYLERFFLSLKRQKLVKNQKTLNKIRTAINEALLNINHHAYLNDPTHPKKWWLYLAYDAREKTIFFDIYDIGIGMVRSYKEFGVQENQFSIFHTDADILKNLIKPGVTRSGELGRGQGLPEMLRPSHEDPAVSLFLFSNKLFYYKIGGLEEECIEMPYTFLGTIAEWQFKLES